MKRLFLPFLLNLIFLLPAFSQSNEDLSKQMEELHKEMEGLMENFSQNFQGQSFFFSDTIRTEEMEKLKKMMESSGAILMDTILIPNMEESWMSFGQQFENAEDLKQMMKEMQKQLHEMPLEDWQNLGKLFEDFGAQFYNPLEPMPEDGVKKEDGTKSKEKKKKKRKTYTL